MTARRYTRWEEAAAAWIRALQILVLMKKERGELGEKGRVRVKRGKLLEKRELARTRGPPHARIIWRAPKKLASTSPISFSETTLERLEDF